MEIHRLIFLLILVCFLSPDEVSSDQVFSAHTGRAALGGGSREPKYRIEFHTEEAPFHPRFSLPLERAENKEKWRAFCARAFFPTQTWVRTSDGSDRDDDQERVLMPDKSGKNFLCFLPNVEKPKNGYPSSPQNTSSMIMETEKQHIVKTPDELLEILKDRCFIRQEGWWTYEFCYHQKLRQFHIEEDKVIQEFILGIFDPEATAAYNQNRSDISILKDPRSKDASQRYHAHQYTNGTICDLTGEPRETEVRFVCSEPRVMVSSITELSTCKYALTVHAPMLCKHQMFQEEKPVWHTINCNALPKNVEEDVKAENTQDEEQIKLVAEAESPLIFEGEKHVV